MTIIDQVNIGSVNIPTTVETVVASSNPVNTGTQVVRIHGNLNFTAGTGATSATARLHRSVDASGPVIRTATFTVVAGNQYQIPFGTKDNAGWLTALPGNQYCVTMQQVAATGNGTVNNGELVTETIP